MSVSKPRVVVCGSLNMDVVVQSARRPAKGETLLGGKVSFFPGGKGLNQAVAAVRLGVHTRLEGAVGDDLFGSDLRHFLVENRIDGAGVKTAYGHATGVAIIQVAEGDNAITVASGANLRARRISGVPDPRRDDVWLAQFETPLRTTEGLFRRARDAGARTILNLAPFTPSPASLLKLVDFAVLNEIELAQATGARVSSASSFKKIVAACAVLRGKGPRNVIATLGARGAAVVTADGATMVKGLAAEVVDTTGAGDCFAGAFAARLALGDMPLDAVRYANAAAACSVERLGAAPSMPTARRVAARLASA